MGGNVQPDLCEADAAPAGTAVATPEWKFRLAVARHHRVVYRMAHALLRDEHEAEDVTQEAFMRYWKSSDSVRRPREWLMRVARNACLDRLRKAGRWAGDDNEALLEGREDRGPAWHVQRDELASRLRRLLDTLPEPQRSLIVLFDIQGMNGNECARILDINPNQVKVYLHRARRRLREKLEQSS